jgi:hypothetical protein
MKKDKISRDFIDILTASTQATSKSIIKEKQPSNYAKVREINKAINFASECNSIAGLFKGNISVLSLQLPTNMSAPNPNIYDSFETSSSKLNLKQQTATYDAITKVVKKNQSQAQYIDFMDFCANSKYNTTRPPLSPGSMKSSRSSNKAHNNKQFPKELDPIQEINNPSKNRAYFQEEEEEEEQGPEEYPEPAFGRQKSPVEKDSSFEFVLQDKRTNPRIPKKKNSDRSPEIPVQEVKLVRTRSQTPTKASNKTSRKNSPKPSQNSSFQINLGDIPISQSHFVWKKGDQSDRRSDFNDLLKTSSSVSDDDFNRDFQGNFQTEENPYTKPLPYFQYSVTRYKQQVGRIPEKPMNQTVMMQELKKNEALNPLKGGQKNVESQYSKKNLPVFLHVDEKKLEGADETFKKNLQHTNQRFLQSKPVHLPESDAGKRFTLPLTPKEKPIYFSHKKENDNMSQSFNKLVQMME